MNWLIVCCVSDENDKGLALKCSPTKKSKENLDSPRRCGETPTRSGLRTKLYSMQLTGNLIWWICYIHACCINNQGGGGLYIKNNNNHYYNTYEWAKNIKIIYRIKVNLSELKDEIKKFFLDCENIPSSKTKPKVADQVVSSPIRVKPIKTAPIGN